MQFSSVRRAHLAALAGLLACTLPGLAAAQAKIGAGSASAVDLRTE